MSLFIATQLLTGVLLSIAAWTQFRWVVPVGVMLVEVPLSGSVLVTLWSGGRYFRSSTTRVLLAFLVYTLVYNFYMISFGSMAVYAKEDWNSDTSTTENDIWISARMVEEWRSRDDGTDFEGFKG